MSNVRTPTAGQPLTLDQFLRDPRIDEKPYLEYVDGRVEAKVSPQFKHSAIQSELLAALNAHARGLRLGRAFPELRCTFAGRSLVPDVVFLTRDQIAKGPDGEYVNEVRIPPALHVEILSPGQGLKGPRDRLAFSTRHGSRLGWLIDPERHKAEAFLPDARRVVLPADGALPVDPVLPGLVLTLPQIFGWLRVDDDE
jgi:Uma2 family endonuclease